MQAYTNAFHKQYLKNLEISVTCMYRIHVNVYVTFILYSFTKSIRKIYCKIKQDRNSSILSSKIILFFFRESEIQIDRPLKDYGYIFQRTILCRESLLEIKRSRLQIYETRKSTSPQL